MLKIMLSRSSISLGLCLAFNSAIFAAESPPTINSTTETLLDRIVPASPEVIKEFESAGMREVRQHKLTDSDRIKISQALAVLPPLHRSVLAERLVSISFIDGIAGEGTALTAPSRRKGKYSITFRSSIINESLTEFLTTKERRLFTTAASGPIVTVTADGLDALPFAFLHESTHIVDNVVGIKTNADHPLIIDEWMTNHDLKMPYAGSIISTTNFRGGSKIPIEDAEAVYDALAMSPFVSLYSTAAASEDIAELLAWYQEQEINNASFVIAITDSNGRTLKRYEPLSFPLVKKRFPQVKQLLDARESGRAISAALNPQ